SMASAAKILKGCNRLQVHASRDSLGSTDSMPTFMKIRARITGTRIASIILLRAALAAAQVNPLDGLDAYIAHAMTTFQVPGVAVAIVKDGKVVLAKGYGLRKLGEPAKVDEHTLFGIGSNTKAFTVAALAMLVDEGTIQWDDKVVERLPGFQ